MKRFKIVFSAVFLLLAVASFAWHSNTPASNVDNPSKIGMPASLHAVDLICSSYSAKNFAAKDVSNEALQLILQCGAKAPSAKNLQPWHFTVVTDYEIASRLVKDAVPGSVVIVVSGRTDSASATFDCALAAQNMYLAAQSLGLGSRIYTSPVENINKNERNALKIPAAFDVVAAICIGHVANQADARSSASKRNPLSDIVNYVR